MAATGVELRAQVDADTVKGLLLVSRRRLPGRHELFDGGNGGGAVALLAFLPVVLGKPEYAALAKAILWALLLFQFGLVAAVIHNRHRRVCSLGYEAAQGDSPQGVDPCHFLGMTLREPCVCARSIAFMWLSLLLFLAGSLVVFTGGMRTVG